jgi:uncharacterized protein YoxC
MSEETFRWVVTGGVAIATLCILVQAVVMLVLFRVVKAVQVKAEPLIEKAEELAAQAKPIMAKVSALATQAEPILVSAKAMLADAQPKAVKISADVVDIVAMVKQQVHEISDFLSDFVGRAKAKVERMDDAIDDTVNHVHHAGENARRAVLWPFREADGVMAGLKAALAAFASGRRPTVDHVTQDEEMFI